LSDEKKRPSLAIPAIARGFAPPQKPGSAMDWRSVVPTAQPVRRTSGPPKPIYKAPVEEAPKPPVKTAPEPQQAEKVAAPGMNDDDELINIQLTGLPADVVEDEPILSALPVEAAEELLQNPQRPIAAPFKDQQKTAPEPRQAENFAAPGNEPPAPVKGELVSNIPQPLLLDDLKRAEFTQRFYNFGRHGSTAADPLSSVDWKQEAEQVLLWKALRIDAELKRLASQSHQSFTDEEIERISHKEIAEMDPQLVNAISPQSPDGNDTRSLAVWLMDVYGLETYERNSFWSRCFPSKKWRTWSGTEIKYKTGFIYEPVSEALLLRKLQDVSDSQTFTTSNGDKVGKLTLNKRDDVLKELRQMLDPEGGGAASIFANMSPQKGFATSEEIPKWISVGPDYSPSSPWTISNRPVEIGDRATFAVPCVFDPKADCPNFKAFLDETFEGADDKQERIDALLEWMAAAIFGETTRRAKALYLYGYTATGKSVVCELVKPAPISAGV
jgi:hypothetical protein